MTIASPGRWQQPRWQVGVLLTLALWLGGSLILDLVIMPSLYAAGMMAEPQFATVGYVMFSLFNRVELFCAALVVTGILALCHKGQTGVRAVRWAVPLAVALLAIALVDTYSLTPQMSALSLSLNWFEPGINFSPQMQQLQGGYWVLEIAKLAIGAALLRLCYSSSKTV